jgi:long-chain acyl-CoA synthetase
MNGAADVPRGSDSTVDEIQYILSHSDVRMAFVENQAQLGKLLSTKERIPNLETPIVMDRTFQSNDQARGFSDVLAVGKRLRDSGNDVIQRRIANIKETDPFTIIYTSGTTGEPKGVMLTHSNMMYQVQNMPGLLGVGPGDVLVSILPIWHVFERAAEYVSISVGCKTIYSSIRHLGEDLRNEKPTFMVCAPRLLEGVYTRILNAIKSRNVIQRAMFKAAYGVSKPYKAGLRFLAGNQLHLTSPNIIWSLIKAVVYLIQSMILFIPNIVLNTIVLRKTRAATGGRIKGLVSGGGALPRHIDRFFNNIGLQVLEGYGLTETSGVTAIRTMKSVVIGTVGPVAPETHVKILDDKGEAVERGKRGVIFVKGPQVMRGYYKNPEGTERVLKDGWFDTGDIGLFTYTKDTLAVTGRAKDTIVLLGGENIEPLPIERMLESSPYIVQAMVVGQDKKTLGALIVPDKENLKEWAVGQHILFEKDEELLTNPQVLKLLRQEITEKVSGKTGFKPFERVVDLRLVPKRFEVGDELTNLLKMKRHVISEKYKDLIEDIFRRVPGAR